MKKLILSVVFVLSAAIIQAQTAVTFYTSKGNFVVEIYDDVSPITGGNFLDLVDAKFYDGVIFHRVIAGFMIQGGDPTGTGSGGPGYSIQDEFINGLSNVQKTISMANAGPNTGGSQFFINLVNNTHLDWDKAPTTSKHPVFGIVINDFNIVQDIGLVATNSSDRPLTDVVMDSLRVGNTITGIKKNVSNETLGLRIFPNPLNESSVLQVKSEKVEIAEIQVHDMLGKQVANQRISLQSGYNQIGLSTFLNMSLLNGMYHVSLVTSNDVQTVNVMVK